MHTTSRNPEYRRCRDVWPKELEDGYSLGQTGRIGAYDLLHRLIDKTATHVRTKINPLRTVPNLQPLEPSRVRRVLAAAGGQGGRGYRVGCDGGRCASAEDRVSAHSDILSAVSVVGSAVFNFDVDSARLTARVSNFCKFASSMFMIASSPLLP